MVLLILDASKSTSDPLPVRLSDLFSADHLGTLRALIRIVATARTKITNEALLTFSKRMKLQNNGLCAHCSDNFVQRSKASDLGSY